MAAPAGAQVSFAAAQTALGSGLNQPAGVAVDGAGDVFIADTLNNRVLKLSAGGGQTILGSGLSQPHGVAVDQAGDVFIADTGNGRIVEIPAGGTAQTTLNVGFTSPVGLAVDRSGDILVADSANTRVVVIPANPQVAVSLLGSGLSQPTGVALDAKGDLFIADSGNNRVVELGPNGQTTVSATGLSIPTGVAVDAAGDVFIANAGNNSVVEIPAGGAQIAIGAGLNQPTGVAVDAAGDVFIADSGNNRVVEVQHSFSVNVGTANVCPSGEATPAPCSQAATLIYNVASTGALHNVSVLTGGAQNLDFTMSSTTCTGELEAGSTCAVNVTFVPRAPGARNGAVQLIYSYNGQQSVVASTLVYGQGQGPALAFGPGVQIPFFMYSLNVPFGEAVDGAGDVFVASSAGNQVIELPAGGAPGSQTTVGSGLNEPSGVALDGAGDVFIADTGNNRVVEVPAGDDAQTTVGSGFQYPSGVAVDGAGDIFIADTGNSRVVEIPAGGGPQITVGTGLNQPFAVAVDGAGDVFISDFGNNRVVEVPAGGGAQTTVGSGLSHPFGIAVDAAGDVFVADAGNLRVAEVPAGGGASTTVASIWTYGVALDSAGNLYLGNLQNTTELELQRAQPPALSFASTAVGSTSEPQAVTIQNIGNQPLNALSPGISINANFEQEAGSGTPADCTSAFALTPGASCNLSISFAPQAIGTLQGAATFTDNALNAPDAMQAMNLSGTATGTAPQAGLSINILAFGSQTVGSTSAAQTVVLSNSGQTALSIASIAVSGNFAETNNCGTSLAAGTSCQISVTFMPQSTGAVGGMLTITDNANNQAASVQTVSLTGTGTANPYDSAISVSLASTSLVYPGATNVVVGVAGNGGKTATGSVTIYDGATALYTATLGGDGKVYWYISPGLSTGTHLISASYTGDSNNPAGQSAAVTVTVSPVPVNLSVSCWNASFPYGGNQTCSVNVSSNAGNASGSIAYIFDSNAPVGISLSSGNAQFTINTPATGSHTVVISYAQQGNFAASAPNTQTFTVTLAPTQIQLTPSSYYFAAGSSLTLAASLTSWSAGPPTSGVATFLDNGTAIGTANVNAQGQASFTIPSVAAGSHNFVAQYGGVTNFAAVTSATVNVTSN
jgi:sugar lactone lactonase YvrE